MKNPKLKILLLGSTGVGKTDLVQRFIQSSLETDFKLTVGIDILTKDFEYNPGKFATLSIWDIGSQQRFEHIRSTFYKGSDGALILFNSTNEDTFKDAKKWLKELKKYAGDNIPFTMVENNISFNGEIEKSIDRNEAYSFAEKEGGFYIKVSSITGENINEAFIELTRRIIKSST
ncbi:MAG: GTP-binding protein [Promethearchaeota archaeon]